MRYQVPQFIEVEDKIFGPLTIKQFIYLAGGAGLSYLVYAFLSKYLPFFITVVFIIPIAVFAIALAFYKVNGRPFILVVENAFSYFIGSKLYIWKKETREVKPTEQASVRQNTLGVPRLADSRLKDLAWKLDVQQNIDDIRSNNK